MTILYAAAHAPAHFAAEGHGLLAAAVLREIAAQLDRLARDPGHTASIDLRSLPLGDGDRAELLAQLGSGEVTARIAVAGETNIRETGFAGVWHLQHASPADEIFGEEIVIARIPALLLAHPDDLGTAAARLQALLATAATGPADALDNTDDDDNHLTARETAHD